MKSEQCPREMSKEPPHFSTRHSSDFRIGVRETKSEISFECVYSKDVSLSLVHQTDKFAHSHRIALRFVPGEDPNLGTLGGSLSKSY